MEKNERSLYFKICRTGIIQRPMLQTIPSLIQEAGEEAKTSEVPTSEEAEPLGPLAMVRTPPVEPGAEPAEDAEAPRAPPMPRRIITPLNSIFSEDVGNAAPELTSQATVLNLFSQLSVP